MRNIATKLQTIEGLIETKRADITRELKKLSDAERYLRSCNCSEKSDRIIDAADGVREHAWKVRDMACELQTLEAKHEVLFSCFEAHNEEAESTS